MNDAWANARKLNAIDVLLLNDVPPSTSPPSDTGVCAKIGGFWWPKVWSMELYGHPEG